MTYLWLILALYFLIFGLTHVVHLLANLATNHPITPLVHLVKPLYAAVAISLSVLFFRLAGVL